MRVVVAVSRSCRNSHVVEGTTIVTKFGNPTREVRSWIVDRFRGSRGGGGGGGGSDVRYKFQNSGG